VEDWRTKEDRMASKLASLRHWIVALTIALVCCGLLMYEGYIEYEKYLELQENYTEMAKQNHEHREIEKDRMDEMSIQVKLYANRYKADSIMLDTQREVIRLFKVKYGK
jgi:hypothetical protein